MHVELVHKGHIVLSNGSRKPVHNIYHYLKPSSVPGKTPEDWFALSATEFPPLYAGWMGSVGAALSPLLAKPFVSDSVSIRPLDEPLLAETICGPGPSGTGGDSRLPSRTTISMNLRVPVRGKGKNGRKFYSCLAKASAERDELNATELAAWTAFGKILVTPINGWQLAVLDGDSQIRESPTNIIMRAVIEAIPNPSLSDMSRRRQKTPSFRPAQARVAVAVTPFAVGTAVECRWKGGETFYPGTISAIDGSRIHIDYADGGKEWTTAEFIRLVDVLDVIEFDDSDSMEVFEVGAVVECRWRGGERYYPGRITAVEDDRYHIDYADGGKEWTTANLIRLADPPAFAVGSVVECRWKGGERYFRGTISAIDGDRIQVAYDDGDTEWTTADLVRPSS